MTLAGGRPTETSESAGAAAAEARRLEDELAAARAGGDWRAELDASTALLVTVHVTSFGPEVTSVGRSGKGRSQEPIEPAGGTGAPPLGTRVRCRPRRH